MSRVRTEANTGGRLLGAYVPAYLVFLYLPLLLIPLFYFYNSILEPCPLQDFTLQ